jgi:hypothetical protein
MKIIVKSNKRLNEIEAGTRYYDAYKGLMSDTKKNMSDLLDGKYRKIIPFESISPKIVNDIGSIMEACSYMVNVKYAHLQKYMSENKSSPYMTQALSMMKADRVEKEDDGFPEERAVDMYMADLENIFYLFHNQFDFYADLQLRQFIKDIPKTLPDGREVIVKKRFSIPVMFNDLVQLLNNLSVDNPKFSFFQELFIASGVDNVTIMINLLEHFKMQVIDYQEIVKIYKNYLIDSILKSNNSMLVLSRVPVDILRMSDFPNLESCHSPEYSNKQGGLYGLCSVQEAKSEYGLIAYLFDTDPASLTKEQINDIENTSKEFMQHSHQRLKGFGPISRIRIRTYRIAYDGKEVMLSIPAPAVYGIQPSKFYSFLVEYFKNKQASIIAKLKAEEKRANKQKYKEHFIVSLMGGFYHDSEVINVVSEFLGVDRKQLYVFSAGYEHNEVSYQNEVRDEYKKFLRDNLYNEYVGSPKITLISEKFTYRGYTTSQSGAGIEAFTVVAFDISYAESLAKEKNIDFAEALYETNAYKEMSKVINANYYPQKNHLVFNIPADYGYPKDKGTLQNICKLITDVLTAIHTDI